ncbi:MAG: family 43 glycosylhydrolase [Butyrivibrio sp.]|nr:family 43 glycosylhydrolase [Butyrivibrio sp.]
MKEKVRVYTRDIDKDEYPFGLAKAIHFEVENEDDKGVRGTTALNNNYAVLFAEGNISKDNTIVPLGIDNPVIFELPGGTIYISGKRIDTDGNSYALDEGRLWTFETHDLIHFETVGLVDPDTIAAYSPSDVLDVDDTIIQAAIKFWNPEKPLDDASVTKYSFPLAKGFGDPVIFKWEGKWYFISTSDNTGDIGIYVREADTVPELFKEDVVQHLILPYDEKRQLIQTFWAPEFHVIGGELYILFAVSGKQWGPQCHLMKFKKGGSIIDPDSWEDPIKVLKKDGSPLSFGAISLDMTYIKAGSGSYVVWSYREHIGDPLDTGSMLYIATIDEKEPWKLTSDPVLLSRPLYGWENLEGTINNEGPYAFIMNNKIYLTYSGGAANGYTYAVGLFTADYDADLLDLTSWTKSISPILTFYNVDEFGPGHNSFFEDDNGNLMIAYHAERNIKEHLRCDMIRRVCFKTDGTPYFV